MSAPVDAKGLVLQWFNKFEADEEQNVALEITSITADTLKLGCGDGSIVFQFEEGTLLLRDVVPHGDKLIRTLVSKTKETLAAEGGASLASTPLAHALNVFSDVAKLLGCGEMTDDDDNDSDGGGMGEGGVTGGGGGGRRRSSGRGGRDADYEYEDGCASQGVGNVSSEFINMYFMKKKWMEKEKEKRQAAAAQADRQVMPGSSKFKDDLFTPFASTQVSLDGHATNNPAGPLPPHACLCVSVPRHLSQVLINDLVDIMGRSDELGFSVEAIDDDIYNWRVKMHRIKVAAAAAASPAACPACVTA